MSDQEFDPREMQLIIERLKAEGRMPSAEKLRQAMEEARSEYQKALEAKRDRPRRAPRKNP